MNILGIGVDMVDIRRVAGIGDIRRAAWFICTDQELHDMEQSRDQIQFFAARLAAKEALIKATPEKCTYHDFSISTKEGKPVVVYTKAQQQRNFFLSIAHEFDYAISYAIVCAS